MTIDPTPEHRHLKPGVSAAEAWSFNVDVGVRCFYVIDCLNDMKESKDLQDDRFVGLTKVLWRVKCSLFLN